MNVIRPRAQGHVQDAAGHASVLCGIAGDLHLELLQRVNVRAHLRGSALHVAVVEAIDVEVGVGGARAVDRCERPLGTAPRDHARNKEGQISEVTSVQGELLDLLLDDHITLDHAVLGVECDHLRIDRHGLSDLAELEFDVDTPVVPRPQFDSLLDMLLEAFGRDDQVVLAGNQRRERVVADRACRQLSGNRGSRVDDGHLGSRDHPAASVGDDSCQRRQICLTETERCEKRHDRQGQNRVLGHCKFPPSIPLYRHLSEGARTSICLMLGIRPVKMG